jgi:GcrA cell cycle regulator
MNWKDPEVAAQLRELWDAGHSCGSIARIISSLLGVSVTRNAVIGAVSRGNFPRRVSMNRLPTRGISKAQLAARKKKPAQPQAGKPFTFRNRVQPEHMSVDPTPIPPPHEFDVPRIATADLEPHHCRFPCVEDVMAVGSYAPIFCGLKAKPGLPYCNEHVRRAFAPPPPRPRPPLMMLPPEHVESEMEAA